jgi:hypothetical protein
MIEMRSASLNSVLHLWASLKSNLTTEYSTSTAFQEGETFEKYLQRMFKRLLDCGAQLNERNAN